MLSVPIIPMQRVAMLGRFQPVHAGQECAIRRAYSIGDVAIGIYRVPLSAYNPFTAGEVDRMLHNSFPDADTFVFDPTLNPVNFARQLEKKAGTKMFYTRSRRAAFLMRALDFQVVYEKRAAPDASYIRKSAAGGGSDWRAWVNPANAEIIEAASTRMLVKPKLFRVSLMRDLYKHGIGF